MEKMLNIYGNLAEKQGERRIITIDPTIKSEHVVLRVAAYARVSTGSEEQLNSYAAQNRYYTDLITAHQDWKLVDIYADEGISGTSTDKRQDFQRMMTDCRRGLIDRILTKSIARFARNAKDCLEAIRELKSIGVSVYFEKEKLDTAIMSSEMITAIMASLAQKESESIGSNMQWSYQKRMERGEFNTNIAPYGFRMRNGQLEIEEREAEDVKLIFQRFLSGKSRSEIAAELRKERAPLGEGIKEWSTSTVYYMLQNERYAGKALLAKYITTDSFPHRRIPNHGEKPQYLVEGSNPAIISQDTFNRVRKLKATRKRTWDYTIRNHPLNKKIVCSCCGAVFKRQQPRDAEYWICYSRYGSKENCSMPSVTTAAIEEAFCRLYYKLKHYGEPILSEMIESRLMVKSCRMLWSLDVIELNKRIADLTNQNQLLSMLKQQGLVDSDIFISRSNAIADQIRKAKQEKSRILESEGDDTLQITQEIVDELACGPEIIDTFDTDLFNALVDKIIVEDAGHIMFLLKNGLKLREEIERIVR